MFVYVEPRTKNNIYIYIYILVPFLAAFRKFFENFQVLTKKFFFIKKFFKIFY